MAAAVKVQECPGVEVKCW